MLRAILHNDIYNMEEKKTASSKLFDIKWCDTHKERYIKVWLSQYEKIQNNQRKKYISPYWIGTR